MSRAVEESGIAGCRPRLAVAFVVLALLAFTTIRTSPLSTGFGPGSSLSTTHPKQRQFSASDFNWTAPVLTRTAVTSLDYGNVLPEGFEYLPREYLSERCSDLPPPTA